MGNIFGRLSRGPQRGNGRGRRTNPNQDFESWDQMVGSAPRDRFQEQAKSAVQQVDPDEYYRHSQPGVDGTDPFGELPPSRRKGLAETLIGALLRTGAQPQQVLGYQYSGSIDPQRLSPAQLAQMAQYLQRNNPQALGQAAGRYQDQPGILQSLLGNKALLALAAGLGAKYLSDRANRNR